MVLYYQTDAEGFFVAALEADASPLDEAEFLIPAGGVTVAPPTLATNQCAKWVNGAWEVLPDFLGQVYWLSYSVKGVVTERGVALPTGATLTQPPIDLLTAQAQALETMDEAYFAAIQVNVSYMGKVFQADLASQDKLVKTILGLNGVAPAGFYWVALDNLKVPMTYAEVTGLASAMWAQGWAAFQHLQDLKGQINTATDSAAVGKIVW